VRALGGALLWALTIAGAAGCGAGRDTTGEVASARARVEVGEVAVEVETTVPDPAAPTAPAAPSRAGCVRRHHPGGDWPALNGDLANTRHQSDEHTIGVGEVADLRPAWSFDGASVGATGGMRSTPIVAHGCVYLGLGQGYLGDRGDVVALDADTGAVVWHVELDGSVLGLAAANGLIYATPSDGTRGDVALPVVTDTYEPAGSSVVALDAATGEIRWRSERLDDGNAANGTFINASPVAFRAAGRPLVFVPLAGGAGDGARVPMYFLDALTGETVARALTLTEAEYDAGFGGTGIWSTAAYDPATQHLYAGTADSDGKTRQHEYNDALLRIDANPTRRTFASVVDSYAGTTEHANLDAVIGHPNNPLCGVLPDGSVELPTFFDTSASVECLELDYDFGSSPNLYRDAAGRLRVSALQKSGVFHSVDAHTMTAAWTAFVGPGGAAMDAGTATIAGDRIYTGATPNLVLELDQETGAVGWIATTGVDLFAYQPLTSANGVVYGINDLGWLMALDAATGRSVVARDIAADGGFRQCIGVGAGVAVAHHTVFVPCDAGGLADLAALPAPPGGLVAYRLPGG
jgi:outer membrane protein assembly factor BamB